MFVNFDIDRNTPDNNNIICNVRTKLSPDGKSATVLYDNPKSDEYLYTVIFDVTEEEYNRGINLTLLLEAHKSADIVDKRTPHDHKVSLSRTGVRCLLYPAKYDIKERTYYLLDQRKDNVTDVLKIQPTIRCNIRYENMRTYIFRPARKKKAVMKISGDSPGPGSCLRYKCKGGGRDSILFGIDMMSFWNREIEIVLNKEEEVTFLPPEDGSFLLKVFS